MLRHDPDRTAVRVTDPAGAPLGPWHPVPPEVAEVWNDPAFFPSVRGVRPVRFVPGTPGVVIEVHRDPGPGGWWDDLRVRLGFAPRSAETAYCWLDGAGGPARPVRTVGRNEYVSFAAGPGCVDVVINDPDGATLEVWTVPPRDPWPPAIVAGVLTGTLAVWRSGRRRKPVEIPPPAPPVVG